MPSGSHQDRRAIAFGTVAGADPPAQKCPPLPALPSERRTHSGRRVIGAGFAVVAASALLPAQVALAAPARDITRPADVAMATNGSNNYTFTTVDDPADLTFNQLLGINDFGVIAGYFGSGSPAATHPNKGYRVAPYSGTTFINENFPGFRADPGYRHSPTTG